MSEQKSAQAINVTVQGDTQMKGVAIGNENQIITDATAANIVQAKDSTVTIAGGDIVAGNKTIINQIIQQAMKQIITAPYKFLASYDICDRDIFFGRTAIIEELVGKIPRYKTLVINGRSGSGKTSLINAGLIPRLAENGYHYLSFRDYSDPMRQLREHVAQDELFKPYTEQTHSLPQFLKVVTRQQHQHLVIIFDQFERFFVNVPAPVRAQFINEIKACLNSDLSGEELDLVFALREDFFGAFVIEFETLMPTFFNDTDRFNLLPLRRDEAREAILRPLKNIPLHIGYNLQFVDEVLLPGLMGESAGGSQIDPPHLQIVCNQLYQAVRERYAADLEQGGLAQIDQMLYETLGETRGILRSYLDDFIDQTAHRDSGGRDVLRSMLKLMMETTGTRKFVSFTDLKTGLPDVQPPTIEQHIREFQDGRIIETRGQGEAARYSLSHEVMVEKVQSWFDERELERKKSQEILERGLAEWKSTEAVLNEKQVAHIRQWLGGAGLSAEAEQLLTTSQQVYEERKRKEAEQERRIRFGKRIVWGVIAVALLVAFGLTIWALRERTVAVFQRDKAQRQENIAKEARTDAEQKQHKAERQAQLALAIFEQKQAQAFVDMLRQFGIRQFAGVPDTIVQEEEALMQQIAQAHQDRLAERAKPLTEQHVTAIEDHQRVLSATLTNLRQRMQQLVPQYEQLKYPQPIVVSDLQKSVLRPGEVILMYDVTRTQTSIWIISQTDFDFVPLNITESELQQDVEVFTTVYQVVLRAYEIGNLIVPEVIANTNYEAAKIGHTLYSKLFPEVIRPFLAHAQTVYIVPTGPLVDIPFEALVTDIPTTDETPHYLVQQPYAIAYLSSASLLNVLRAGRTQRSPSAREPLLAFANPEVSGTQFAPRPDNEITVRAVAETLKMPADSPALCFGEHAARRNLLRLNEQQQLSAYRYLFFSTYGIVPGQIEMVTQPALVLAHPETAEGYLTMADAFKLRLNADLVVLAAGNTAGNRQHAYLGFPRAWTYAGASAVIATLWKIDSKLAHELITRLFQHLQAGQAPAVALQHAKQEVIAKGQQDVAFGHWQHPFFWSSFILFGDGSP